VLASAPGGLAPAACVGVTAAVRADRLYDPASRTGRGVTSTPNPVGSPTVRSTRAPEASATRRDRSPPVHRGSTRSRQVQDCNGHQRSPRELRNRSSYLQRSHHQAALQVAGQSSSLPTHAVTTLVGRLSACAELPGPRRLRLGVPARPVPAPGTCALPAHLRPGAGA